MKPVALTATLLAATLVACVPRSTYPTFQPGETWTDEHGNECEAETAHLAECVTPDGHGFTLETRPSAESLAQDPVKAVMYGATKIR